MTVQPLDEEAIFHAARVISSPVGLADYLAQACGDNQALRARVEGLLKIYAEEKSFAGMPAEILATIEHQPISEQPGTVIGQYKLMEQIGEGGFGLVFVAEQQQPVRRKVALKVIKPGMDTRDVIARFEAERQALALMDHPNIARVFDAGATDSGRPYFVMELVRGVPITEYCDEQHLTPRQRLELFVSLCHAIQHAHQKGIIHRDVKPTNALVTEHDGRPVVKVIDFGVAKALSQQLTQHTIYTQFAQMIGTPLYMSPEQAAMSGLDVDTRSDIYSLGVLLYELLTGTTPFDRERLHQAAVDEIRRIIREEEPPKPSTRVSTLKGDLLSTVADGRKIDPRKLSQSLRGDLDWIVMKCLEKDRTRRYETADALALDVQRHLDNEPVVARPSSGLYRFQKLVRRNKLAFAAASAVLAALILGLSASTWMFFKEKAARERAVAAEREQARLRQQAEAEEQKAKIAAAKNELAADYISNLVHVVDEDQIAEAEGFLHPVLTPALERQPEGAVLLRFRAILRARAGRWKEATADLSRVIEFEPVENTLDYHYLAPLLVHSGDVEAYRRLCSEMVARFGKTTDPIVAERMVKDCSILPSSDGDLEALSDMADAAIAAGPDHYAFPFFQFAKGLSELRRGRFVSAADWLEKVLAKSGEFDFRDAQAYLVLAMARHHLNQPFEARAALAKGNEIAKTKLPPLESGDPGDYWHDWVIVGALQREAQALIEGQSPETPASSK